MNLAVAFVLEDGDVDDAVVQMQNPAAGERGPLQNEGSDQHVETDAAETVPLEKRHQKTKADEHHHVNVLKDCTRQSADEPVHQCVYYFAPRKRDECARLSVRAHISETTHPSFTNFCACCLWP